MIVYEVFNFKNLFVIILKVIADLYSPWKGPYWS